MLFSAENCVTSRNVCNIIMITWGSQRAAPFFCNIQCTLEIMLSILLLLANDTLFWEYYRSIPVLPLLCRVQHYHASCELAETRVLQLSVRILYAAVLYLAAYTDIVYADICQKSGSPYSSKRADGPLNTTTHLSKNSIDKGSEM